VKPLIKDDVEGESNLTRRPKFEGVHLNDYECNSIVAQFVKIVDPGQCFCGSIKNLHFDHDIPFSKGGSSLTAVNVRLLCAKHNLEKSDKILTIAPWIFAGAAAVPHIHKFPAWHWQPADWTDLDLKKLQRRGKALIFVTQENASSRTICTRRSCALRRQR